MVIGLFGRCDVNISKQIDRETTEKLYNFCHRVYF